MMQVQYNILFTKRIEIHRNQDICYLYLEFHKYIVNSN
jgi:hypothetical protein